MVIKQYAVMLGLLFAAQGVFAQDSSMSSMNDAKSYWADSSKVSTKNMAQYNEFRNNMYPYPAKPRDMWQLGITGGVLMPLFDVPNAAFPGWHAGLNLRKSLGYLVSVKVGVEYGETKGYEYRLGTSPFNIPLSARSAYGNNGTWIPNYKMQAIIPSVEMMFSFSNILFHKGNPKSNVYFTAGYTPFAYHTTIDALNANGQPYDFKGQIDFTQKRTDIQKDIKNLLDGSYETDATVRGRSQNFDDASSNWQFRHSAFIGGGYEFKLSNRVSLGLEAKYYILSDDYIDGKYLQRDGSSLTPEKDNLISGDVTLGFNLGNASKRTEPLWFQNPLNYIYNEVNAPEHMKIPTPVLPDADSDGVTDQFDQEPNTPAGAPVDSHGVAKDTDGDGVPDYNDKELLTPQKCFPVDADGVGKCPPTCCDSLDQYRLGACNLSGLPSVEFKGTSNTLSKAAQASLASVAQMIQNNPGCKIRVVGHGASDKRAQQRSWDRVNAVIQYMVNQQGISESRFIFIYGTDGDANVVDLEGTTEEGPNSAPAPSPQYQR